MIWWRPKQAFSAPLLLLRAVARHGIANVVIFGRRLLKRRGLLGAIRYATLTTVQRRQEAVRERRLSLIARTDIHYESRETDFDPEFGIVSSRWNEWKDSWAGGLSAAVARPSVGCGAEIGVIIVGEPASGEAVARTLRALAALATGPEKLTFKVYTNVIPSGQLGDGLVRISSLVDLPKRETDWILYLRAGDKPSVDLGQHLANINLATEVVTFDLMFIENGKIWPLLCPGANPILAREFNYIFSRIIVRPKLMFQGPEVNIEDGYAVLYQWLTARSTRDAESRWMHLNKTIFEISLTNAKLAELLEKLPLSVAPYTGRSRVSVVICTKDNGNLLYQLVRALWSFSRSLIAEIIVISNNTTNKYALKNLELMSSNGRIIVYKYDEPFNFSRMSNFGVQAATGDHILFLNDDIAPITDDWLGALLGNFSADGEVGVAGPLLIYPDERIQHAGMYLGFREAAGHVLRFARLPEGVYLYYASARRQVSAVTGAAMLVSRVCFNALNGFDENLPTFLQDVDFCLRARHAGFVVVFDPRAILMHMESATMKELLQESNFSQKRQSEADYYYKRWGNLGRIDPFHNSAFATDDETLKTLS